jgi:hypothetical protein
MLQAPAIGMEELCSVVRAEYLEMPGLRLSKPQVQRLWNLDSLMCETMVSDLVSLGFLRRTPDGEYVLAARTSSSSSARRRRAS